MTGTGDSAHALDGFSPETGDWFRETLGTPTPVQVQAWEAIARGDNALVIAPTGSGKTLAAFLHAIDRLATASPATQKATQRTTRVLYISPVKALAADVRGNLDVPLAGIAPGRVSVGMRSGDTTAGERAKLIRKPPDILVTTPESLYLMLTSRAAETLRGVDTVIVDEVHSVAGTKRGSHLALSLERLDELVETPAQRIGLSATVRPVDTVASFLGGKHPVTVVQPAGAKVPDVRIEVPVENLGDVAGASGGARDSAAAASAADERAGSVWPHIEAAVLDRVMAHRSTIVFTNSRGLCERLTARLNELYAQRRGQPWPHVLHSATGPTTGRADLDDGATARDPDADDNPPDIIAMSHHGSVSKEQRLLVESQLKSGDLRCVVATSSLELGIDMGQVDLVVQIAAPPDVAAGLQRVGRANHQVHGTAAGIVYPRTRRDLLDAAVVTERMERGAIEELAPPQRPLDVLAQHTVAAVVAASSDDPADQLTADAWFAVVTRAHPYRDLTRKSFDSVLGMLAGRWSAEDFAAFRPAIVWDRHTGALSPRPSARGLATVNAGTIPDRGAYAVVLPEGQEAAGARRVGELDEEMVHESRVGDVITLGAGAWRITEIGTDRVVVAPAPGRSARLPFWHGEGPGRPAELGQAIGRFTRDFDGEAAEAAEESSRVQRNLAAFFAEQRDATGEVPGDDRLVAEVCPDEVGDLRIILHSPWGRRIHAPWALALSERLVDRFGSDATVMAADDGIVARIPGTSHPESIVPELFRFDPDRLQTRVEKLVGGSALFAARFRECASRALLLPRRSPGKRAPLWQQRLRAGQLLQSVSEFPDFPILIETARECLQDVYDLPAARRLMAALGEGRVRMTVVHTQVPSPFAGDLLFGYVGELLYETDKPLAERRASALALDPDMLAQLVGTGDAADLLDSRVMERVEAELQHTAAERRVHGTEGVADLLRTLGPLTADHVERRLTDDDGDAATTPLAELARDGRAIEVFLGGTTRWAAVEDAGNLRAVLGDAVLAGPSPGTTAHDIPAEFLDPSPEPLRALLLRFARTHTVFSADRAAAALGVGTALVAPALDRLAGTDDLVAVAGDWIHREVFTRVRARGLRAAREATRPVPGHAYARLLAERQYVERPLRGPDGLARVIEQLAGLALPASAWESHVLPARVADFTPRMLDELIASGEVVWAPVDPPTSRDPTVALHVRESAGETLAVEQPAAELEADGLASRLAELLAGGGAWTAEELADRVDPPAADGENVTDALWELARRGLACSDSFAAARGVGPSTGHGPHHSGRPRLTRRGSSGRGRGRTGVRSSSSYRSLPPVRGTLPATAQQPAAQQSTAQAAGRWSLTRIEPADPTTRAVGLVESLLDRYGVVTRAVAFAEALPGGFAALRPVLTALEDAGAVIRGRFIAGLGAAQFAQPATVDRLRTLAAGAPTETDQALTLAATDPANPYGQGLPWPSTAEPAAGTPAPKRTIGALTVLTAGLPAAWLGRGGKTLLTFPQATASPVAESLIAALRRFGTPDFVLETIDGAPAGTHAWAPALQAAGFKIAPRGLRYYAT